MTILIVDNSIERLDSLEECVRELFPAAQIRAEKDPFDAGRYGMFHPVDMLISELEAGRMDALQLGGLIRHVNPGVKVYVTGEYQSLQDWEIIDENGTIMEEHICGALPYPVTPEKLGVMLGQAGDKGGNIR